MKRRYKFAGIEVEILIPDENDMKQEGTLNSFRVERVNNPKKFQFNVVDSLSAPIGEKVACYPGNQIFRTKDTWIRYCGVVEAGWEKSFMRVENTGDVFSVQIRKNECQGIIGSKVILNALGVEKILLDAGGIVLHASFVSHNGKAILFTAPSGVGKSTQAELWKKYREADIINGDRVAVRWDGENVWACGIPYAGSSLYCKNEILPIQAIVYLGQATETQICRLSGVQAFRKVWEGCSVETWDKDITERVSEIVLQIVKKTPIYHLTCAADETSVIALEKSIEREGM